MENLQKIIDVCELLKKHGKFDENENLLNPEAFEVLPLDADIMVWSSNKDYRVYHILSKMKDGMDFRLKLEPKIRAFKDAKEFFPHSKKTLKSQRTNTIFNICDFNDYFVFTRNEQISYEDLLCNMDFVSLDAETNEFIYEPCGVKE